MQKTPPALRSTAASSAGAGVAARTEPRTMGAAFRHRQTRKLPIRHEEHRTRLGKFQSSAQAGDWQDPGELGDDAGECHCRYMLARINWWHGVRHANGHLVIQP